MTFALLRHTRTWAVPQYQYSDTCGKAVNLAKSRKPPMIKSWSITWTSTHLVFRFAVAFGRPPRNLHGGVEAVAFAQLVELAHPVRDVDCDVTQLTLQPVRDASRSLIQLDRRPPDSV